MCMEIPDITMHLRNQDMMKFLCSVQESELGLRRKKKNKRRKFRKQTSN